LQVSFLLEANAKNLHQTGRAFIMREVLLHISEHATRDLAWPKLKFALEMLRKYLF
jgi:hypothetical protein